MDDINRQLIEHYRSSFLAEVEANVEEGEWVKMCMQCGVCSGSCPLGPSWDFGPQTLFMMIRANKRDEVLRSSSMWMCTSCYNCIVRCPRGLPITHIMHGLAHYAERLGLAPRQQPTRMFALMFWDNLMNTGRVNELKLGVRLYFMHGFFKGIVTALKMAPMGLSMVLTKRMNPMETFKSHGIKDRKGFHAMIEKARELEAARLARHEGRGKGAS